MSQLDLTGSFIIGGLVLFTIVFFQLNYENAARQNSMSEIQQTTITEFGRVVEYDFHKLGYRVLSGPKITRLETTDIQFRADLDNDGVVDTVRYYLSQNRNGVLLVRHVAADQEKEFSLPVAQCSIIAYDSTGTITTQQNRVKSIQIDLLMEQNFLSLDRRDQVGAFWTRRFFPKNL